MRQEYRGGAHGQDIVGRAYDLARAADLPESGRQAVRTLLCPADGIQLDWLAGERRTSYINGQHCAQAMLEMGVRRTLVIRWQTPGVPVPGQPSAEPELGEP